MQPRINSNRPVIVEALHLHRVSRIWKLEEYHDHVELFCPEGLRLTVKCAYGNLEDPLEKFVVIPVSQVYTSEVEIVHLRFQNQRFGFVFPAVSLVSGDALNETYMPVFAAAAIRAIFFTSVVCDLIRPISLGSETLAALDFDDLFNTPLSLAVMPRDDLKKNSLCIKDIHWMLSSAGFLTQLPGKIHKAVHAPYERTLPLKLPSKLLNDDTGILTSLLCMSMHQNSPQARFILLYQVLELLISKIFRCEMRKQIQRFHDADIWDLKEKIFDISKEVYRLNQLQNLYLQNFPKRELFNECQRACNEFLGSLAVVAKNDNWASSLYTTRNIIVHRQHEFEQLPENFLYNVCDSLRDLLVCIVQSYNEKHYELWVHPTGSDIY